VTLTIRSLTVRMHRLQMRNAVAGELRAIEEARDAREMAQALPEPGALPVEYIDTRPAFLDGRLVAQFCRGAEIVTQREMPATPETISTLSAWAAAANVRFIKPA
jgi:hypothetical protein